MLTSWRLKLAPRTGPGFIRSKEPNLPDKIAADELISINARRRNMGQAEARSEALSGLALSGGGIRSATFSLGVLQALARRDLLKRFDYLSTVSGGGYIGGSLTWLVSRLSGGDFSVARDKLPYGVDDPTETRCADGVLLHLRRKGDYLTPGGGLTAFSLANAVIRGVTLNLVLWVPVFMLVAAVLIWLTNGAWRAAHGAAPAWTWRLVQLNGSFVAVKGGAFDGINGALYVLLAGLIAFAVIYSMLSRIPADRLKIRYKLRLFVDRWARAPIAAAIGLMILSSMPLVHDALQNYIAEAGLASVLLGAAGGLGAFFRSGEKGGGSLKSFPIGLIALVLVYGLGLLIYEGSLHLIAAGVNLPGYRHWFYPWLFSSSSHWGGALLLLVLMAWIADLNYISVHRYYRDRLMEAFMPDVDKVVRGKGERHSAVGADRAKIADFVDTPSASGDHVNGPYPLVNTNVVLVDSKNRLYELRGGDNFILSPRYCGSTATGWLASRQFMRGSLTLSTAVAISGAALNPNAGVGGEGPTRNRTLSLLMNLLNLRLGYWIPNPGIRWQWARPTHLTAFAYELLAHGHHEDSDYLQISDGGHFENLAVYELVRRKAKLIVCCDAGADPEFSFSDLQVLVRHIDHDFQARLLFEPDQHLQEIIPNTKMRYPDGAQATQRAHVHGKIVYNDGTEGVFVLLKTAMLDDVGIRLKGYKGKQPDFPDQSTTDQFFDEEQFDAYRELGFRIAEKMLNDSSLDLEAKLRSLAPDAPPGQAREV